MKIEDKFPPENYSGENRLRDPVHVCPRHPRSFGDRERAENTCEVRLEVEMTHSGNVHEENWATESVVLCSFMIKLLLLRIIFREPSFRNFGQLRRAIITSW